MLKTFKYYTITAGGTPQPLLGTTLTTALAAYSGENDQLVTVGDTSMFFNGSWATFDSGSNEERGLVDKIVSSTQMRVKFLKLAHAATVTVRLSISVNQIYVQTVDGAAGALFLFNGPATTVFASSTGVGMVAKLLNVPASSPPIDFGSVVGTCMDANNTDYWWVDGTTADKYLVTLGII